MSTARIYPRQPRPLEALIPPGWKRVIEAARHFSIDHRRVRNLISCGRVDYIRRHSYTLVKLADIKKWLDHCQELRKKFDGGASTDQLAREYGISRSQVAGRISHI